MKKSKANGHFKVEKGIPIPPRHGGRVSKYPWEKMKPGESFLADKAAVSAATSWQRKHAGSKFVSRRDGEGFRIWRVK